MEFNEERKESIKEALIIGVLFGLSISILTAVILIQYKFR